MSLNQIELLKIFTAIAQVEGKELPQSRVASTTFGAELVGLIANKLHSQEMKTSEILLLLTDIIRFLIFQEAINERAERALAACLALRLIKNPLDHKAFDEYSKKVDEKMGE